MGQFFPDATVTGWDGRHVLAAAIVGGADATVTANLSDFPDHALARFDIVVTHPDDVLLDQWGGGFCCGVVEPGLSAALDGRPRSCCAGLSPWGGPSRR